MIESVKIEGTIWAYWHISDWPTIEPSFVFYFERYDFNHDRNRKSGHILIAPYTIEIEMPIHIDLRKSTLKFLQKKRKLILAENESRAQKIDGEIQTLLAIEHKG
jgi:hypothetical protein